MDAPFRADRLAERLLADRAKQAVRPSYKAATCFICERTYTPRPIDDEGSTRFCGVHCREAFDADSPPGAENPGLHPELMLNLYGHVGWVAVAGPPGTDLQSPYYAALLEHCERKRKAKAKAKNPDLIRPQRQCESCGGDIPNWQGEGKARRRTGSNVRFCSKKCSKIGPSRSEIVPEATIPRSQLFGPSTPPLNLVGGYRWPGAPHVDLKS